jgi:predicted ABC-type ATPase
VGAVDAKTRLTEIDELRSPAAAGLERRLDRLPDSHPSSPRYETDRRDADEIRPLTDAEHADHVADVKSRLAEARAAGLDTSVRHTIDAKHEIWSDDREAAQDAIVDDLYSRAAAVPCDHRAIVTGGLPGAGKTTVLRQHADLDLSNYLVINPDVIKDALARRGLIPEVAGLSPLEAAGLVHEESSHIAKALAHRAQAEGKNLVWDVTMSRAESCAGRIEALRSAGYTWIEAVFVDVPVEVSILRTDARHRGGQEDYRAGLGFGGRFVPNEMTAYQSDPDWGSRNRANFEQVKSRFDAWSVYDNSVDGRAAELIAASTPDPVRDREGFE